MLAVASRVTQRGALECFSTSSDGSVRVWTADVHSSRPAAAAGASHSAAVTAIVALSLESCLLLITGDRLVYTVTYIIS